MLIEAGKYYVTRGGDVAGPAMPQPHSARYPWHIEGFGSYPNDGRFNGEFNDSKDLVKIDVAASVRFSFSKSTVHNFIWFIYDRSVRVAEVYSEKNAEMFCDALNVYDR